MSKRVEIQTNLLDWYESQKRPLPWRKNRNPYRIWISEIMLQQTTVTAVIPYYERFMKTFPNLKTLANAPLGQVLEHWAGLGYYSRARNLHKSAKRIAESGFPKTHEELIKYPGFGPYSARSVTSLAFDEPVGVLDGNVIRILSRLLDLDVEWWKAAGRSRLQSEVDQLVQGTSSSTMNQALMELGATICKPTSPACMICPWHKNCLARKRQSWEHLPRSKPKKAKQIWLWQPQVVLKKQKVALTKNNYAPFLKGQWLYPGTAKQLTQAPKSFSFRHNITHHEIYVQLPSKKLKQRPLAPLSKEKIEWGQIEKLHEWNPSALLSKVIERGSL